ncbi:hypothetical protein TRIUR3_28627 [Triticum urartu]|uniref:Uncharacterized protein n=1 Tax=Triticum urartu TaxID=4572 RepID=M8A261_TRIUA|nr:hypothetical protein TRIUR3_28627 [Triticum urartu]
MASKTALMAVLFLVLVAGDLAHGHAVPPLGRARRSLGWMQGMKGGPPSGMQPSETAASAARRRAISWVQEGEESSWAGGMEERKFIAPVPGFKLPPLPPNAA